MITSLKELTFAISMGVIYSAHAQPILFHSTLTVNAVADSHVSVGRDKQLAQHMGKNTFKIKGRASDYYFTVNYQHNGQRKEAICEISGAPEQIVATINPAKDGREACKTEETRRG